MAPLCVGCEKPAEDLETRTANGASFNAETKRYEWDSLGPDQGSLVHADCGKWPGAEVQKLFDKTIGEN